MSGTFAKRDIEVSEELSSVETYCAFNRFVCIAFVSEELSSVETLLRGDAHSAV